MHSASTGNRPRTQLWQPLGVAALMITAALLVGCASAANNNNARPAATVASVQTAAPVRAAATTAPVSTTAPAAAISSAGAATPAATPARAQVATPAANPVERVTGTVQGIAGDVVTLADGAHFSLSGQPAVTRRVLSAASALMRGQVVAITAKRQPDNTLLASIVMVFAAPPAGLALGQRPLDAGNLMTNATIESVAGMSFTATFPGGGAQVTIAPDAQIIVLMGGSIADITQGTTVSASVKDGIAQSVSIQ